jgi:hypothetical protein
MPNKTQKNDTPSKDKNRMPERNENAQTQERSNSAGKQGNQQQRNPDQRQNQ